MKKLLSIIVPSYNMEKYLPNGLASLVVNDTTLLQLLDVIVVNDGSKDRTSEIAHGFAVKYPDVFRVIDKVNGNYGSCVNAALPVAAGRFVKILDADDSYDTEAFERFLRTLVTLPATTDVVFNDYVSVNETGCVTETTTYPFPIDAAFDIKTIIERISFVQMYALAYRTELLRQIDYRQMEGISYTDTEWTYLPLAFAREIHYVAEPVYRYLFGRDGQTVSRMSVVRNAWMLDKILDEMLAQYETIPCSTEGKEYLQWRLKSVFAVSVNWHLVSAFSPNLNGYFRWLRQKAETYDFLANITHGWVVMASTPFCFHFADFMLRHPCFARPTMLLVRSYSWLRTKF